MNKEALALWTSALESGKYRQINCPMHAGDGFDVLGVLVDVYRLKFGGEWTASKCLCADLSSNFVDHMEFLHCSHLPPDVVMNWLGARCKCKGGLKHDPKCNGERILALMWSMVSFVDVNDLRLKPEACKE